VELLETVYGPMTLEAPQMSGAVAQLAEIRTEVYIISARRAHTIRFVQDWLSKHRVYDLIPAERIVFCGTDEEKRGYCERLGIDLFLDDKVSVLDTLPGRTARVLYDEDGMHEKLEIGDRLTIAKNWSEFRDIAVGKGMA
jgi:5'(3')-deoxyribonucleotidase